MNLLLMSKGYPLITILKADRQKYYRALANADKKKFEDIVKFFAQAIERSLDIYIAAFQTKANAKEAWISLSELSKQSEFSSKYLNLLARSGKLAAHKDGRIWYSSKKALDEYLAGRERIR
jgi:hypothetical protein